MSLLETGSPLPDGAAAGAEELLEELLLEELLLELLEELLLPDELLPVLAGAEEPLPPPQAARSIASASIKANTLVVFFIP